MKVRHNDVRSFLCSRSARPQKGLARRPQSKAPHTVAWLALNWRREYEWRAQARINLPRSRVNVSTWWKRQPRADHLLPTCG
jgi:hypothetical protein